MSTGSLSQSRLRKLATNRMGLWLFFLSESMIFVILIISSPERIAKSIVKAIKGLINARGK